MIEYQKKNIPSWIMFTFLIIALIGFFDASYLTVEHFRRVSVGCMIFSGCDLVTTSKYSMVGSVPIALLGMMYYLFLVIGTLGSFFLKKQKIFILTTRFSILGFFASVYFFYLQAFVIMAFCSWCLISAITSTLLFILSVMILFFKAV